MIGKAIRITSRIRSVTTNGITPRKIVEKHKILIPGKQKRNHFHSGAAAYENKQDNAARNK